KARGGGNESFGDTASNHAESSSPFLSHAVKCADDTENRAEESDERARAGDGSQNPKVFLELTYHSDSAALRRTLRRFAIALRVERAEEHLPEVGLFRVANLPGRRRITGFQALSDGFSQPRQTRTQGQEDEGSLEDDRPGHDREEQQGPHDPAALQKKLAKII